MKNVIVKRLDERDKHGRRYISLAQAQSDSAIYSTPVENPVGSKALDQMVCEHVTVIRAPDRSWCGSCGKVAW